MIPSIIKKEGTPKWLYEVLRKHDELLRSSSQQFDAIDRGESPISGGLTINLEDYLKLSGRGQGQYSHKRVTFEAKTITAGGIVPDSSQYGVGLTCYKNSLGEKPNVNFSIEEKGSSQVSVVNKEWIFPAFNLLTNGPTNGYHYFVDESEYQKITHKAFLTCDWNVFDTAGTGFSFDKGSDRNTLGTAVQTFNILIAGNFPSCTWPFSKEDSGPTAGIQPIIYIPPLDTGTPSSSGNAANREKKHIFCISRAGQQDTPFEKGSIMGSSFSGKELYPMPTTAHGFFVTPIGGELPQYWPTITVTDVKLTVSSNILTSIIGFIGVKVGMRVTPNISSITPNWETFGDDVFVTDISGLPNSIQISANWSGSTTGNNQILNFFGPIWTTPSSLSSSIDHSLLLHLSSDDHPQYLLLAGRSGGQVIGASSHTGALNNTSLAIEGQLLVGDSITSYTAGRGLEVRHLATANGSCMVVTQLLTGLTGIASGTLTGFSAGIQGQPVWTSGSFTIQGMSYAVSINVPSGVLLTEMRGANIAASIGSATGTLSIAEGAIITMNGPTLNSGGSTLTEIGGVDCGASNRAAPATLIYGIRIKQPSGGSYSGAVTDAVGIEFTSSPKFANSANVATWHGIRIPTMPLPTNAWALDIDDIKSRHLGEVAIGWTPATNAAVTAFLHLGASGGGAGSSPLKFTAGTNLGTPEAGATEYDGSKLYFTHGDAVRTLLVTQRGQVDLTGQTAAIGATTLYAAPAAGYYVVNYTLECTTADNVTPAVSVQFQINYTDDIGATNQTGAALSLAVTGRDRGAFQVWCNAGQNIQYQTNVVTIGTAQYALRVRLVFLG